MCIWMFICVFMLIHNTGSISHNSTFFEFPHDKSKLGIYAGDCLKFGCVLWNWMSFCGAYWDL